MTHLGTMKTTHRGFTYVGFVDALGEPATLQCSSALGSYEDANAKPGSSYVWLGADESSVRLHLDREQVAGLIERLQQWLDFGEFRDDADSNSAPCPICAGRAVLTRAAELIDTIPETGSPLFDDEVTDAYSAVDSAAAVWQCDCEVNA